MKTMQPKRDTSGRAISAPSRGWNSALVAAAVVVAMIAGGLVGFLLWGTEDDTIVAGGGSLTARQEQMVELFDDYVEAWQDGDGTAAEDMFTTGGYISMLGTEYRRSDGSLADIIERRPVPTMEILEPTLVARNTLFNYHELGGATYQNVVQFNTTGDVAIISHTLTN